MPGAAEVAPRGRDGSWSVVLPVKPARLAKSRLRGEFAGRRAELAMAFAEDVVAAARACPSVDLVVAVTNDAAAAARLGARGALVVPDRPDSGLNAALRHGAAQVRGLQARAWIAAVQADLPAATADLLDEALRRAAAFPSAFLADAAGTGTTLYAATDALFAPRFGPGSAAAHRADGAHEIEPSGLERLRLDVDTDDDLRAALGMGVGPCTAAVLGSPHRDPDAPAHHRHAEQPRQ